MKKEVCSEIWFEDAIHYGRQLQEYHRIECIYLYKLTFWDIYHSMMVMKYLKLLFDNRFLINSNLQTGDLWLIARPIFLLFRCPSYTACVHWAARQKCAKIVGNLLEVQRYNGFIKRSMWESFGRGPGSSPSRALAKVPLYDSDVWLIAYCLARLWILLLCKSSSCWIRLRLSYVGRSGNIL